MRFKETNGQEGHLVKRFYLTRVNAQGICITFINGVILVLKSENFEGKRLKTFPVYTENFIIPFALHGHCHVIKNSKFVYIKSQQ